jgi:biotin carboxyl carrier protein
MERRYLVSVGGDERAVSVERHADFDLVRVGGLELRARPLPDGGWLLRMADGRVHRVDVSARRDSTTVVLDGHPYTATARSERDAMLGVGRGGAGKSGRVSTSMPGKIVKILVLEGQTVEEGQGLLILEAMKMENQVKAPVAGVVARIHVREGDSVESDALLVEIEELPSA